MTDHPTPDALIERMARDVPLAEVAPLARKLCELDGHDPDEQPWGECPLWTDYIDKATALLPEITAARAQGREEGLREAAKTATQHLAQECCGNGVWDGGENQTCCGQPDHFPIELDEAITAILARIPTDQTEIDP